MLSGQRINALPKQEIARGKKRLSMLFAGGKRLKARYLQLLFMNFDPGVAGNGAPVRVLFSVGKRLVPGAVERNRIRRLMREAYRLEKRVLEGCAECSGAEKAGGVTLIALMYRGRREAEPTLTELRKDIHKLLAQMAKCRNGTVSDGDER
jgi:ribonuclease P protein component